MKNRRQARTKVMQALYAWELSGTDTDQIVDNVIKVSDGKKKDEKIELFAVSLFLRSLDHREEIDEIIGRHTLNWDISRIALIDRLLIRAAITEFLYFQDIPPKVTINEAIEIAKTYSTGRSGKFVNGILDAVLRELKEAGRLKKSGRGLVDFVPKQGKKDED